MDGEIPVGEERTNAGDIDPGPHGRVSKIVVFIIDTIVKAFFILFFNVIFSVLFRMFLT